MGSIERKLSRKKQKQAKKDLKQKIGLFDKLDDECLACQSPYDKTSKKDVQSWYVAVHKEKSTVNLYCPKCWEGAQKLIQQMGEENE
tara:strand:- start:498 stop:758 length:261 start_codon:yes stop_codon:yes gene_type:complete